MTQKIITILENQIDVVLLIWTTVLFFEDGREGIHFKEIKPIQNSCTINDRFLKSKQQKAWK
jgi:hypothetical protein